MTDTEAPATSAGEAHQRTVVCVAVADVIDGSADLADALRFQVIRPVLREFPLEIRETLDIASLRESDLEKAKEAPLPIVVADVAGAPPELLLSLASRDSGVGRTILLAPASAPEDARRAGVVRYPASAEAIGAQAGALREALRTDLVGDRTRIAADAQRVRTDAVGTGRLERLRHIEAATLPLGAPDPALTELCLAYIGLGAPGDALRLVEAETRGLSRVNSAGFERTLAWAYAFALNRRGIAQKRKDLCAEAERILIERIAASDADAEVHAALGRVFKDRWEAGGRKTKRTLGNAIKAYSAGFNDGGDYYPGVNALTLMVVAGRDQSKIDDLAQRVLESLDRGRNPDEHPWWYWATRVQVEVIRGDFGAANEALDGLLSQPSEPWMRESSAQDLARIAECLNPRNRTPRSEVEDSALVRQILEVRHAVLNNGRPGRRGMPAHCILEATRRGGTRWVNFTNGEPRPLFCRGETEDEEQLSILAGDPVGKMLSNEDATAREETMAGIGSQLQAGFRLDEGSLTKEVLAGEYFVMQVDEQTALEPWEFLTDKPGAVLSLEFPFARRVWLEDRPVRRRSSKRSSRALVIGDPLGDLPGARAEANEVVERLTASGVFSGGVVALMSPDQATMDEIGTAFEAGGIDLLHYAGHAVGAAGRAPGLLLAEGPLQPAHLAGWGTTPTIIFANACSSAEMPDSAPKRAVVRPSFVTKFAEAGVGIYLGCAWPVGDAQAATFSRAFYAELLCGRPVGHSVRDARLKVRKDYGRGDPYWGAYVLYGNPWYRFVDQTVRTRSG